MKDIELPPLPDLGSQWTPYWTKVVHKQMQSYARAAVEAAQTQRVPDVWKVEKGFRWDGARQQHIPQLIVEFEPVSFDGPCDAKGWQDRNAVAALLASTPAPAQQEPSDAEMVCAEAYQVVGCLLSDLGMFETEAARKILDNLSEARMVHQDVLPWESAVAHKEPPQPVERKPMTDEQAVKCIEAAGFKTWTSAHFRLVKEAERHHGIKE